MKQFTPISKSLHFNALSLSELDKFSMCYLQMNALKHTIKIIVLPSFSRHKLKLLSKCCVFKVQTLSYLHVTLRVVNRNRSI